MTTLKLQYDNFETGEFTEEIQVDKDYALTKFDENTELIEAKRSFTIKRPYIKFYLKSGNNYLCVIHFAKDAFTIWYCNDPDDKLYEGNFYKKTTRKVIELFCESNFEEINKLVPRTSKSENKLISDFYKKDFLYVYRQRGIFNLILVTALYLPIIFFFTYISINSATYILIPFVLIMTTFFILLYVVHFNHINQSKNLSIQFSSGSDKIKIFKDKITIEFEKSDIEKFYLFIGSGYRNPLSEYSYSQIVLKDKRIFNISYMIIDPFNVGYKLNKIPTDTKLTGLPYMKITAPNTGL